MLKAQQISFSIGKDSILSSVNVQVTPGNVSLLLGPSGAGKTTLLRCLSLLQPPSSGSVIIDDQEFSFPASHKFIPPWPKVTAVFQQHFLWPHLTLRQNILLSLRLNKLPVDGGVDELIEVLNLSSFIDRFPSRASLGERQRAAIARALVLKPKFILLDEVTSALDVEQSFAILEHLVELKKRGIGILLITHHLEFARAILRQDSKDSFYFMDQGQIIESGDLIRLENPINERVSTFLEKMGYQLPIKIS